jgi:hypothetical protein
MMQEMRLPPIILPLAAVGVLAGGCYTPEVRNVGPTFHEAGSADVVVQFYRWNDFFIIQPELRDNGFLRPLNSGNFDASLAELGVKHDMAVVLVGRNYESSETQRIITDWRSKLARLGFHRVVFLAGNDSKELDGLPVIDDWNQPSNEATPISPL